VSTALTEVLDDDGVEAVAIATPAASHGALVHECLEMNRHVFVEKPLTTLLRDALVYADMAARRGLILACDHTYCFSPLVRRLRTLIRDGGLGELKRIDSTRVNRGEPQPGVDVFWDLGHHDLAILDFVVPPDQRPTALEACGVDALGIGRASAGEMTVRLDGVATAHIRLDWAGSRKVRTMKIAGSRHTVRWDDLTRPRRLAIDSGPNILIDDGSEALSGAAGEFIRAIHEERTPTIGVAAELRVLQMLEATTLSQERGGTPVPLVLQGVA
jgi:predicted dehydrogenase